MRSWLASPIPHSPYYGGFESVVAGARGHEAAHGKVSGKVDLYGECKCQLTRSACQ